MKKIPGTLYEFELTNSRDMKYNLKMLYRTRLVMEKSSLTEAEIKTNIQNLLLENQLNIPSNRIAWIVNEELKNVSPSSDVTFTESTLSEMLDEFEKKPSDEMKKIILMGLSNAGKTCIYERVFEGKKPWELMNSAATKGIAYRNYQVGSRIKPMIWDLGGQQQYLDEYHGALKTNIFQQASILLYVVDVLDSARYEAARNEFQWAVNQLLAFNPKAKIFLFFHKIDVIHDKDVLFHHLKNRFSQQIDHKITCYATSIFDESLFRAWSDIICEISPKSTYINSLLKQLKNQQEIRDVLLLEKTTGLACGSTLELSDEEVTIGMVCLLMVTIDKVTQGMHLQNLKEFSLKTMDAHVLLTDVTPELMLIIIMTNPSLSPERLGQIEVLYKEVSEQINKLWYGDW
ncbi:MAG TPA: ADP-ribosylation factor-like protein [Candidatus Deferrimicrobium sp.]|nr:ADP-ribosylation factor-like protein [Candidatus Deferrimicrobium sp.]